MSNLSIDSVKSYIEKKYATFPLNRPITNSDGRIQCSCGNPNCGKQTGKHPVGYLVPRGHKDATKDLAVANSWFGPDEQWNIGIATGAISGFFVVDVDPAKGGEYSLQALEKKYGPLPKTFRVRTGSGGQHVWFKHPSRKVKNSTEEIGPDLDIRGDGGYVVAPPSRHFSGGTTQFWTISKL